MARTRSSPHPTGDEGRPAHYGKGIMDSARLSTRGASPAPVDLLHLVQEEEDRPVDDHRKVDHKVRDTGVPHHDKEVGHGRGQRNEEEGGHASRSPGRG